MLLNYGTGEESWESPGLQGNQTSKPKGNQLRLFIGRSVADGEGPIFWSPGAKRLFIGKDPDDGKIKSKWRRELQRMINEHEFEWTPGDSRGQMIVVSYSPWGHKE